MRLTIEQSSDNNEIEINIKCGQIIDEKLQKLIDQIRLYSFSIIGKKNKEIYQISLKDVFYIESVEEKTFLYLEKDIYEASLKLYELEQQLANTSYIRVSKSIILNIEKLQSVKPLINGKLEANLQNGEKILINRHYVPEFKKKFGI
ncbi:LytTR family DNA-binding domain-containing protein [Intestinibacter sp.]